MPGFGSSCGCLLWFIDGFVKKFRNRRIWRTNNKNRKLRKRSTTPIDEVFPPDAFGGSFIISGGGQSNRLYLSEQIIGNAKNANHPIIIIHTANGALERVIAGNNFGNVVSSRSKVFDAFTSFELNDIYHLVTETYKSKYDIKPAGRYILQVVHELVQSKGRRPYFSDYATCPYFNLTDTIAKRLTNGVISQATADKLNSLLFTGQSELPKIDTFFSDAKSQIDYLSAPNPNNTGAVGILSAIRNKQILCIDVQSSSNTMLIELIVNSLIIAMNRGYDFSLFVDDISFTNNDLLKNTICQKSKHSNIILSKDLYSLTGGKDDVFSTIISEADKTVLFAHNSGTSCEKWSKYLGEYDKIDLSNNRSGGYGAVGRVMYSSNSGQTETLKREHRVKPEQIRSLSQGEAFIFDSRTDKLLQTVIV